MAITIEDIAKHLDFRVLVEYDDVHNEYVAQCLETGAIATDPESSEGAMSGLRAVLDNDLKFAIQFGTLSSLFRISAPADAWERWLRAKSGGRESIAIRWQPVCTPANRWRFVDCLSNQHPESKSTDQ